MSVLTETWNLNPQDVGLVEDLLSFYQRELQSGDSGGGREALAKLGLHDPKVIQRFALGYASGAALDAAGEDRYRRLCRLGLARKRAERMKGCVVVPVYDAEGQLADLCGLRPWDSGLRFVYWQRPPRGLIGVDSLTSGGGGDVGEVIVCDNAFHALHAVQHGYRRVVAVRSVDELAGHLPLLRSAGVARVVLVSRRDRAKLTPPLENAGIEVVAVKTPHDRVIVPERCYREAMSKSSSPPEHDARGDDRDHVGRGGATPIPERVALTSEGESRLIFSAGELRYRVDPQALPSPGSGSSLSLKASLRVEHTPDGRAFLDRADLGSATQRDKLAKACGGRLNISARTIGSHLEQIADRLDGFADPPEAPEDQQGRTLKLTAEEREQAMQVLRYQDVLSWLADALESCCGFVGEDAAKRLGLLVATSRLLPQPLGSLIRGPAGCGKSSLMQAIARTLPGAEVLSFSRLTPQALYFLPKNALQGKLLVCDEYEGLASSEYALRSLMSSQKLSLAITLREGGRVPVTRQVEVPARLAVMVSTTGSVNVENLSRFVEVGLDAGSEQTRKVMQAHAPRKPANGHRDAFRGVQAVNQLLSPASVVIPFADQLSYAASSVLARRRFAQVVGLIAAHALLHQHQRPRPRSTDNGDGLTIEAQPGDYAAVYPLLGHVVEHFEEDLTPPAMKLLDHVERCEMPRVTREQVMESMGWSYSKAYRVLQELVRLDLLIPDTTTNGVLRTYEVAPYHRRDRGVSQLTPPDALSAPGS